MNAPTSVDESAPVIARHEIDIDAPLARVWQLQTDINGWPTWQPDITAASFGGALEAGASFTWTSFGFTVTSTFYDIAIGVRLLWGGTGNGITGVHERLFHPTPGGVHVTTNESFSGEPVNADPAGMQTVLDGSLMSWLGHLKAAAEAQASA